MDLIRNIKLGISLTLMLLISSSISAQYPNKDEVETVYHQGNSELHEDLIVAEFVDYVRSGKDIVLTFTLSHTGQRSAIDIKGFGYTAYMSGVRPYPTSIKDNLGNTHQITSLNIGGQTPKAYVPGADYAQVTIPKQAKVGCSMTIGNVSEKATHFTDFLISFYASPKVGIEGAPYSFSFEGLKIYSTDFFEQMD